MSNQWDGVLKLKPDIMVGEPQQGQIVLLGKDGTTPLRISGFACQLVDKLQQEATLSELEALMKENNPSASQRQLRRTLERFLEKLSSNNIIETEQQASSSESLAQASAAQSGWYFPQADKLVAVLAAPFALFPRALRTVIALLCLAGACGVVGYGAMLDKLGVGEESLLIPPEHYYLPLLGVLILPIWWTLHELGHGITCRLAGFPIAGAGLRFRGWLLPSPYVDVRSLMLTSNKWHKINCAMAGPFVDLLVLAALVAAILQLPNQSPDSSLSINLSLSSGLENLAWLAYPLRGAFWFVSIGFIFNLSPWRQSDGMVALSHFFADPLIMRGALYGATSPHQNPVSLRAYQVIAWTYLAGLLTLFGLLLWQTYLFVESLIVSYA